VSACKVSLTSLLLLLLTRSGEEKNEFVRVGKGYLAESE